jgi:hypothetical protein
VPSLRHAQAGLTSACLLGSKAGHHGPLLRRIALTNFVPIAGVVRVAELQHLRLTLSVDALHFQEAPGRTWLSGVVCCGRGDCEAN